MIIKEFLFVNMPRRYIMDDLKTHKNKKTVREINEIIFCTMICKLLKIKLGFSSKQKLIMSAHMETL